MIDPTDVEISAMVAASERAGEYLESVGKTDLAQFSQDEFMTLVEAICTGFTDYLSENPPF